MNKVNESLSESFDSIWNNSISGATNSYLRKALDHKRKFYFMMLLNSNWLYYCRQLKSKIFFKNNDSFHLGATPKHFSFTCLNSNFPPFLWPLICSYWVWLTNELVNKQYLVWFCSNQMFLRSRVVSKHLEEGSLPQMFKNPSPRQKMCLNQKLFHTWKLQIVINLLNSFSK